MERHLQTTLPDVLTLAVGLARHDADWNWRNVRSPFARLYCVTEGEAQVVLPQGTYNLRPGRLYLIPPFTTHSNVCHGQFTHYYIHVYETTEGISLFDEWDFPVEVEAGEVDRMLFDRLCEMNPQLRLIQSNPSAYDNHQTLMNNLRLNLQRPLADKVESRGILLVLLSRFLRQATRKAEATDNRIQQTIAYIRRHIGEPLQLAELASQACMSKDHYIRMFRQSTGQTPTAYIIARRMERAELLLVTTPMPVKQLAMKVGYDDTSYFNRLFRRHTGLSPVAYRKDGGFLHGRHSAGDLSI